MIFISEILILRSLKISDAQSVAKYANNKNVWKNLNPEFPHPYFVEDALSFISRQDHIYPVEVFAIDFENEVIGTVGIVKNEDNISGDIGYWIGEKYWNKGITTSVVRKFADYCFETFINFDYLTAKVYPANIASARVLEKNGFKKDHFLKDIVFTNGVKKDFFVYKLMRNEIQ